MWLLQSSLQMKEQVFVKRHLSQWPLMEGWAKDTLENKGGATEGYWGWAVHRQCPPFLLVKHKCAPSLHSDSTTAIASSRSAFNTNSSIFIFFLSCPAVRQQPHGHLNAIGFISPGWVCWAHSVSWRTLRISFRNKCWTRLLGKPQTNKES